MLSDKWTLERLLGIGGMAAVYEGRHRNGARAAIKVLHASLSRHAEVRERFLREGYAANRVDHPGAVKVLDDEVIASGADTGLAYIVMELLEGESMQDRVERPPPLTESEFLRLAEGILDVLDSAHTRGVVHRDLKPENLFLVRAREGEPPPPSRVKILDFGLARLLDGQTITSHGLALGTPSFMSPEQAAGRIDEIDGRTDLFALGATGFRVRTGRRVQEGANPVELVTRMAKLPAPRIRTIDPEVSEAYARIIDRALEYNRDDRYPDAAAMRDDVRRAILELDGNARTVLAIEAPVIPKPSSPRVPAAPIASPRPPPPPAPAPPAVPRDPSGETTVELSEKDLRPSSGDSSSLPVIAPPPRRKRRSLLPWLTLAIFGAIGGKLWLDGHTVPELPALAPAASTAPSTAPKVAATAVTASAPAASVAVPPSAQAAAPLPSASEEPASPDAEADDDAPAVGNALSDASSTVVAASDAPPASAPPPLPPPAVATAAHVVSPPVPAAVASHSRPPPKVGPGNVHVLPGKHRKKASH